MRRTTWIAAAAVLAVTMGYEVEGAVVVSDEGFIPPSLFVESWGARGRNYDSDIPNFELLLGEVGQNDQTWEQKLYWGSSGTRSASFSVTYDKPTTTASFAVDVNVGSAPDGLITSTVITRDISDIDGLSSVPDLSALAVFGRATESSGFMNVTNLQLTTTGGVFNLPDVSVNNGGPQFAYTAFEGFSINLSDGFTLTGDVSYRSFGDVAAEDQSFTVWIGESTIIPEPASLLLLGMAGLAVAMRRRG